MANGEGALVAQQRAADEIPYQNIDSAQKSIQLGLSAWQTANAIKLKRAEIEGKMFALQQRNTQLEANMELREKMFGLAEQKNAWEKEKAFAMVDEAKNRAGIQEETQQRLWATMGLKAQKDKLVADDQAGFLDAMYTMGKHPGDPGYDDDVFEIASKFPYLSKSTANVAIRSAIQQHQAQVQRNQTAFDHKEKSFWEDYGRTVYGDKTNQNPLPLTYTGTDIPGKVEAETTHEGGFLGFGGTYKPTGNVNITSIDSKGVSHTNTVSTQTLTNLNKEYQQLIEEKNKLPSMRNYPQIDLYATDPNRQRALAIRDDPSKSAAAHAAAQKWLDAHPQ